MRGTLGICVTRPNELGHLLGITRAAVRMGKCVEIFITGEGVQITQQPGFAELVEVATVAVCEVSYIKAGYRHLKIPELLDKDFVTQWRNAEMVDRCGRYLVL